MPNSAYLTFLQDPDAIARRDEMRLYFGPNAEKYLPVYDRLYADANRAPGQRPRFSLFRAGFSGPAFFIGPVWFFYRKLWLYGALLTATLLVLAFLPGTSHISLPVSLGIALFAKQAYVTHSIITVAKLRANLSPSESLAPQALEAAGGVSRPAGWIGGIIYATPSIGGLAAMIYLIHTGQPPPR